MLPQLSTLGTIRVAVALLVTTSGMLMLLLFIVRIRKRDYSLLYFGLAAAIYGLRLFLQATERAQGMADLTFTVLLPIPLVLFFADTVAPEWKKAVWWLVGIDLATAVTAVGIRAFNPNSTIPWSINSVVVLLSMPVYVALVYFPRRPPDRDLQVLRGGLIVFLLFVIYTNLFWLRQIHKNIVWLQFARGSGYLEFIGFFVLLCCLGWVAFSRLQRNEEHLLSLHKELDIARSIQARLLPQSTMSAGELTIASRYVPATSVAGDFYDFIPSDHGLGVLIADVSGHGIPAALSASMVKVAVRAQMGRAAEPAGVLRGMNSILFGNLEGQFVSAGYLFLSPAQKMMTYGGAGHPPVLVWRSRGEQIESLEENGFPLGIFSNGQYSAKEAPLAHGDRCVLYTDGLLEAPAPTGEEFGPERLRQFIAEHAALPAQAFCDALIERLEEWCRPTQKPHDDLTIVVVDFA